MIYKEVYKYSEAEDKILSALEKLSGPVVQTLTPKGRNVLFQDDRGNTLITNDGWRILQSMSFKDPIENAVLEIVKQASFKTNQVAGDGTTTTTLLSNNVIRNGLRLIQAGYHPMDLSRELRAVSSLLVDEIESRKQEIKSDKDLEYIANISANNDPEVAQNVLRVVKKAGEDGMVFLHDSNKDKIEITEEEGFVLDQGMFAPHFATQKGGFVAEYQDVPVFITDKRLYYEEEVMALLNAVASMGENKVVIIAADFIGQAPNIFIANHMDEKVNMNILLIKEPNAEILEDLATYVGVGVVTEKRGSFTSQLSQIDFGRLDRIYADPKRTLIFNNKSKNSAILKNRIKAIKDKIEEVETDSDEETKLKKRLACMTNGIITIKVGGKTAPETREKLLRYEDSINATRNAMKHGYIPGGGITLYSAYKTLSDSGKLGKFSQEVQDLTRRFCEAPLQQVALNCNLHYPTMISKVNDKIGYNAMTDKYEDMVKAGVIEPVLVLKMAVENSLSVGQIMLSSDYMIITKDTDEDKTD